MTAPLSLVADLGGTNTRVALAEGHRVLADTVRRFRNAEHRGIEDVLAAYRAEVERAIACEGACIAVAGPVRDGVAQVTNLDWIIDGGAVSRATGAATVAVLNDLQAQGHAIGFVDASCETCLAEGATAAPDAAKLVIGVGTGFNAAPVYETADGRHVPPSEAGHAGLPVRSEQEFQLARALERVHGFTSIEDVLSGRGIERVYAWLGDHAGTPRAASAAEVVGALERAEDPRAEEAMRIFVRLYGAVAGNLALSYLPFGGVFLVGGVARHVAPWLGPMGFGEAFRDKGRFSTFMRQFPVTVITDDFAALVGCAAHLARRMAGAPPRE